MELFVGYLVIVVLYIAVTELGHRRERTEREAERQEWRDERRELLNAIITQERISAPAAPLWTPQHVVPEDEGEMAKVGMIVLGGDDE